MENELKNLEVDLEQIHKLNVYGQISKLKNKIKRERFILWSLIFSLAVALFLLKDCSGKKEAKYETQIKSKNDSIALLKKQNDDLRNYNRNLRAIPIVENTRKGKIVTAIIVGSEDNRPAIQIIENVIITRNIEVPVSCPEPEPIYSDCPDINEDLLNQIVETDSLLNDSIKICLEKQYRQDSTIVMMERSIQLEEFLLNPSPSIYYTNTHIEYLPNPYRMKKEKSFRNALILGGGSVIVYGVTEMLGHPKYWDDKDNSEAEKKSDLILGLRIGSGLLATAILFEFGRTIYFHKMEGKFIVNPTKIGFVLYLDRPESKKRN